MQILVALVWRTFITHRLHANAVHGPIAESGPPLSIHIHVHAWSVSARLVFSPAGKLQMPTVDVFKITTSLQVRQTMFLLPYKDKYYIFKSFQEIL